MHGWEGESVLSRCGHSLAEGARFCPSCGLRKQLYEKSIRDDLRCIDVAVAQRDAPDANLCLKIFRLHSREIDAFDPKRYEELKARVTSIRKKEK